MTGKNKDDPCWKEREELKDAEVNAYLASYGGSIPPSHTTIEKVVPKIVDNELIRQGEERKKKHRKT